MRIPRLAALAALGVSVLLTACDTSGVDPLPPEGQPLPTPVSLLPLEVGNQWAMSYTLTDSSGVVHEAMADTFAVTRDTLVNGETWYYVSPLGPRAHLAGLCGYVANRADGLYRLIRREDGSVVPVIYFPTNVEPGTTLEIEGSYDPTVMETATMTLVSTDDPFELPGVGRVPSYHYRRTTTSITLEGYPQPIDVEGLSFEFRFSPEYGLLQQQNMFVFGRELLDWRRSGPGV